MEFSDANPHGKRRTNVRSTGNGMTEEAAPATMPECLRSLPGIGRYLASAERLCKERARLRSAGGDRTEHEATGSTPESHQNIPSLASYLPAIENVFKADTAIGLPLALPSQVPAEIDASLNSERRAGRKWAKMFLQAAFTKLDGRDARGERLSDEQRRLEDLFEEQLRTKLARQEYDLETITKRISGLFVRALTIHEDILVDKVRAESRLRQFCNADLSFENRLKNIRCFLGKHKWLVMQVIDGESFDEFVGFPYRWTLAYGRILEMVMAPQRLGAALPQASHEGAQSGEQTLPPTAAPNTNASSAESHQSRSRRSRDWSGQRQSESDVTSSSSSQYAGARDQHGLETSDDHARLKQTSSLSLEVVSKEDLDRARTLVDEIFKNRQT